MKSLSLLLLTAGITLGVVSNASAQARHERVVMTPIKKDGKVVGAQFKFWLRPHNYTGYTKVRVGLGNNKHPDKQNLLRDHRTIASDKANSKGFILHQVEENGITADT
jgi:hypothetical protein